MPLLFLCGDCLLAAALDFLHSGFHLGFGRNIYYPNGSKINVYLHSVASVYLFLAVDLNPLDQRVYQFRRQLFYFGEFARRLRELTQIYLLLLSVFTL